MNTPAYTDPIPATEYEQEVRKGQWWTRAGFKRGYAGVEEDSFADLRKNDWEPTSSPGSGASLWAWRGILAKGLWGQMAKAMDQGLVPPEGQTDFWSTPYFRSIGLSSLLFPSKHENEETNANRLVVAWRFFDKWPQLLAFTVREKKSAWSHPLIQFARPGYEGSFNKLLDVGMFDDFISRMEGYRLTPSGLVQMGLNRKFMPLCLLAAKLPGFNPNESVPSYNSVRSLMHDAAVRNDSASILWLHSLGVPLEATDRSGKTPLLLAARQGATASIETLVKLGADLHARDRFGQSAAHIAIEGVSTVRMPAHGQGSSWVPKDKAEINQSLDRAAATLVMLKRLGGDIHAVVPPALKGKALKLSKERFALATAAGVPIKASRKTPSMAAEGETASEQISRREAEHRLDPTRGLPEGSRARVFDAVFRDAFTPFEPEVEYDEAPAAPAFGRRRF